METTGEPITDAAVDSPELAADVPPTDAWQSLFNGVDLTGWQRYLSKLSTAPASEPSLGLENDPRGVFSVTEMDGEPAIHVTGEIWGALISERVFENFQLRLEYKWGQRTWPPLNAFDSGIMVLSTGPLGAVNMGGPGLSNPPGSGSFLVSMEYQLTPSDAGALYNLGPIAGQCAPPTPKREVDPPGWNQVEIVVHAGSIETFLNRTRPDGGQVTACSGLQVTWPGQPTMALTSGKLQLQSESGEIYFRRVEVLLLP